MAPPTTVLDFFSFQNSNLITAVNNAQSDLTGKQGTFATASANLANLQSQLATVASDMTSVRSQLAQSATPGDGNALVAKLQADIIAWRQQTGAIAEATRVLTNAKADADVAASELQRLSAALAASTAALQDATTQANRRSAMKAALTVPPLNTIAADAAAVLAGTAFVDAANHFKIADAQNRLQGDLPHPLMAEAAERLQDEITRATASSSEYLDAELDVESKWTSEGGVTGAVAALQAAFDRATAAFSEYVATASDRFQQAKASLATVADPNSSPLSPAEKASIQAATVVADAEAAATAEKAVDDARAAVAQKQAILDDKIRAARAADIDADPSTDAAVTAATADLNNAQTQLNNAQAAYTVALQQQAAAWAVLVPDSEWQLLWAFESAQAALNWLKTPGPAAALSAAMDTAEQALVTALLAADKSQRTIAELKAEAAKQAEIAQYETTAAPARQFSALRGDF